MQNRRGERKRKWKEKKVKQIEEEKGKEKGYLLALYLRFSRSRISKFIGTIYLLPRFVPSLVAVYAMMNIVKDSGLLYRLSLLVPETSALYAWKPGLLKLEDAITRYMVSVPRGRNSKSVKVLAV